MCAYISDVDSFNFVIKKLETNYTMSINNNQQVELIINVSFIKVAELINSI